MGDTSSSAGSVKSDGGSSVDSPMSTAAEVSVPRDVLLSMNEYMTGVDNLVESALLWEKATGLIITGGKSTPFYFFAVASHSVTALNFFVHLYIL